LTTLDRIAVAIFAPLEWRFRCLGANCLSSAGISGPRPPHAWLTAETETRLKVDWAAEDGALTVVVTHCLAAVGQWIDGNDDVRGAINRSARQIVMNTVMPHRDEIGIYVSDVVGRWDDTTLVNRLELTVGRDLQFIRINGTVVGGIVGLILFTLTRALG
jgi:uncharacterized membrane-anchored protein YjiN (DUF445 family)